MRCFCTSPTRVFVASFTAHPDSLIRTRPSSDIAEGHLDGETDDLDQSTDDVGEQRVSFTFDTPTSFTMAPSTRSAQRQTFFSDPQSFSEKHRNINRRVNVKRWERNTVCIDFTPRDNYNTASSSIQVAISYYTRVYFKSMVFSDSKLPDISIMQLLYETSIDLSRCQTRLV